MSECLGQAVLRGAGMCSLFPPDVFFFSLSGEDEDQYEQFMLPLTAAFETVAQMFSTNTFNEQEAKVSWAGPPPITVLSLLFPLGAVRVSVQTGENKQLLQRGSHSALRT